MGDRAELIEIDEEFGDGWYLGRRNTKSNIRGTFFLKSIRSLRQKRVLGCCNSEVADIATGTQQPLLASKLQESASLKILDFQQQY